jgi:hypothetical protein
MRRARERRESGQVIEKVCGAVARHVPWKTR